MHPSLLYVLFSVLTILQPEPAPLKIDFNSHSYIRINFTGVDDSILVAPNYYTNLSGKAYQTDQFSVAGDTSVILTLQADMPKLHDLAIGKVIVPVFASLNDTVDVHIDYRKKKIHYTGLHSRVNQYYLQSLKLRYQNQNRANHLYRNENGKWISIYKQFDSLENTQRKFLESFENLPDWFRTYETVQLRYLYAEKKISGPNYRRFLENEIAPELTSTQFDFLKGLDLNNPMNKYSQGFYLFMNFYAFYKIYGPDYVVHDSVTQLFNNVEFATRMFEEFDAIQEENFLAFATSNTLLDIRNNRIRKEPRLSYLQDKFGAENKYVAYLLSEAEKYAVRNLDRGDEAPNILLTSASDTEKWLKDFSGELILLNFFIPGCKPCIKEVPYEKALLDEFEKSGLKILNVCVTNNKESFAGAVDKFGMDGENFYAPYNWAELIRKKYRISGYPYYYLVGRDGKIVMNNSYRPSNPLLKDLIRENL